MRGVRGMRKRAPLRHYFLSPCHAWFSSTLPYIIFALFQRYHRCRYYYFHAASLIFDAIFDAIDFLIIISFHYFAGFTLRRCFAAAMRARATHVFRRRSERRERR